MAVLFFLGWSPETFYSPIRHLFSGEVFTDKRVITGGSLDQPSLHKYYFLFCYDLFFVALWILGIRLVCDRNQKLVQSIFSIFSTVLLLAPFSILTVTVIYNLRYISVMGATPWRIGGLVFGALGYAVLGCVLGWVWSKGRRSGKTT